MSTSNTAIVQAAFAAWNAQDMDGFRDKLDSGVVVRPPEEWPESGPFAGVDEVMGLLQENRDLWEADRLEAVGDFIEVGDRVAVRYRWHGRGRGVEQSLEATCLATIHRGKVIDVRLMRDHDEVLTLLGQSG